MYRQYQKLELEFDRKPNFSNKKAIDMLSYMYFWLSSLCVVYEGFISKDVQNSFAPWLGIDSMINIHCQSINHQHSQIGKELKLFRNATFHFQSSADKHLKFLRVDLARDPVRWAVNFHNEFKMLFSRYQVERTVRYILQEDNKDTHVEKATT
jgi:hypothetical protein